MNRRHVLFALAVLFPLALFVGAKVATRWRPVKIGALVGRGSGLDNWLVRANATTVTAGNEPFTNFDLRAGTARGTWTECATDTGTWTYELRAGKPAHLLLRAPGFSRSYALPGVTMSGPKVPVRPQSQVRVSPVAGRLELLDDDLGYFRWSLSTAKLERRHYAMLPEELNFNGIRLPMGKALSRDSETLVLAGRHEIQRVSTAPPYVAQKVAIAANVPAPRAARADFIQISPDGDLAFYGTSPKTSRTRWDVVDSRTGSRLWNFSTNYFPAALVFAKNADEVAVLGAGRDWQVRDAQTGALARTLPRVPNTVAGAFSPDGQTLYSLANGVLYRQRAR